MSSHLTLRKGWFFPGIKTKIQEQHRGRVPTSRQSHPPSISRQREADKKMRNLTGEEAALFQRNLAADPRRVQTETLQ